MVEPQLIPFVRLRDAEVQPAPTLSYGHLPSAWCRACHRGLETSIPMLASGHQISPFAQSCTDVHEQMGPGWCENTLKSQLLHPWCEGSCCHIALRCISWRVDYWLLLRLAWRGLIAEGFPAREQRGPLQSLTLWLGTGFIPAPGFVLGWSLFQMWPR